MQDCTLPVVLQCGSTAPYHLNSPAPPATADEQDAIFHDRFITDDAQAIAPGREWMCLNSSRNLILVLNPKLNPPIHERPLGGLQHFDDLETIFAIATGGSSGLNAFQKMVTLDLQRFDPFYWIHGPLAVSI